MGNLLEINEVGVELAPAFENLIEVIVAPGEKTASIPLPSLKVCLETKHIEPVTSEIFKKDVSPTAIIEASLLRWKHDFEDDEIAEGVGSDKSQALGLLAHQIMEGLGDGCSLEDLCSDNSHNNKDLIGIGEIEVQEVLKHLRLLKDHPLVKEMESAIEFRNEFQIVRPFGKYILSGRLDKVIKTPEGWKVLDFKFSESERHSEAYEFQMKFYLYLAREIFSPLLHAELFYLKDGVSVKVQLNKEEVPDFENDLFKRIIKWA